MVRQGARSITEICRGGGGGAAFGESEAQELARLRAEVRQLKMERDILKKATAFFVREST